MSGILAPAGIIGTVAGGLLHDASSIGLSAVSGWVVAGSEAMLDEVVKAIGLVSTPSFTASWFSATYWRVSALALLLTLPFLFAAAVQAIVRTDLGVLIRAALVDLPIAAIGVSLAAPLITLLLDATDEMCALVTGGQSAGASFLQATAANLGQVHGGFLLMIIAVVILVAGMLLMVELIIRSAAIYVVVLFLPLGFAAMVWPARRIWIKRLAELLVALILSKFAMVAILTLAVTGLASIGTHGSSLTTALTAMTLLLLACASPWALLRLLPFGEMAADAHATLRRGAGEAPGHAVAAVAPAVAAGAFAARAVDPLGDALRSMRRRDADAPSEDHGQPGHDPVGAGESLADGTSPAEVPAASGGGGGLLLGDGGAGAEPSAGAEPGAGPEPGAGATVRPSGTLGAEDRSSRPELESMGLSLPEGEAGVDLNFLNDNLDQSPPHHDGSADPGDGPNPS